jgi:uncharacterized protein YpmS
MLLIAAALACNMPGPEQTTPTPPEIIPVTTEAAVQLEENLESAIQSFQASEPVKVEITEAQFTSFLTFQLAHIQEPKISAIQVQLDNGQVQVTGQVDQNGLSLPLEITFTISANQQGQIAYQIIDAKIGPLPLPQNITDQLTQLDTSLWTQIDPNLEDFFIDNITIANGTMTISGHIP